MKIKSIHDLQTSFKTILLKNIKVLVILCISLIIVSFLSVYPTRLLGDIINLLGHKESSNNVKLLIYMYIIIRIFHLCLNIFSQYFQEYIKSKMEYELRTEAISKLTNMNMIDFEKMQSTQLVSRIFDAINQLVSTITSAITWIGKSLTTVIFTFYFLIKIDATITLVFIPLIFCMAFFTKKISNKRKMLSKKEAEEASYVKDLVQEIVCSFREIKTYDCKEWILNRYNKKEDNWRKAKIKSNFLSSAIFWLLSLFGIIVVSIILIIAIQKSITNELKSGDITVLLLYSGTIFMNIMEVFNQIIVFNTLEAVIERFNEIMDKTCIESNCNLELIDNKYNIEFNNVSFSYDGKNDILKEINFNIPFGKSVAIVGQSGSGKSTLLKLLLGLYSPSKGTIKINGVDIGKFSEKDLKKLITCVFQNTFLYNSSIYDNVALGMNINNKLLESVLTLSDSSTFVKESPEGFNTIVGERGSNLSGGQQQRIGIARCLLTDCKIMLLDEISSSLDAITENNIINNVKKIKNKTLITVSHRPNMILWTDYVIVLDKGQIVDIGTHEQLLNRCEIYIKIINEKHIS